MILLLAGFLLGMAVLGLLLWYVLIETEGVYLGRGTVAWLYDVFAVRYDAIKGEDPHHERLLLALPLLAACAPHRDPLVLDIATGTARLPLSLCLEPAFEGQIIAVDISRGMLARAALKLAEDLSWVDLLHAPAECLPFPDDTFDVMTFLEALEFTGDPEGALREALRVLRPGGVLLTTLRQNVRTMPGKIWSRQQLKAVLEQFGAEEVTFEPWQHEYVKVWARKRGNSPWRGAHPLEAVLCCPTCGDIAFCYAPPRFTCESCGTQIEVGEDGVLEVRRVQRC